MKKIFFFLVVAITIMINYIIFDPDSAKADPTTPPSSASSGEVSESPSPTPTPPAVLLQEALNTAPAGPVSVSSAIGSSSFEITDTNVDLDLGNHSLDLSGVTITFSSSNNLKLTKGTNSITFSKNSSNSSTSSINGSSPIISFNDSSNTFTLSNITLTNINTTTSSSIILSDSSLTENNTITCNKLSILTSSIDMNSTFTCNDDLVLQNSSLDGKNITTCNNMTLENSKITKDYTFKVRKKSSGHNTVTMINNNKELYTLQTPEDPSGFSQIKSNDTTKACIDCMDSENGTISYTNITDFDITVGRTTSDIASSERNKFFVNTKVDGKYSITIKGGYYLTLADGSTNKFILKAAISGSSGFLDTLITPRTTTNKIHPDANSDSSSRIFEDTSICSNLDTLTAIQIKNVVLELNTDSEKTLADIELYNEFKIYLKKGNKLNFVYNPNNNNPKKLLIFEPTNQDEGSITSRPIDNTNDRNSYDATVRTSHPPYICDTTFQGLLIKDLNIDVGKNADITISKDIKYSKIMGNKDNEVVIDGYDLIRQIPNFNRVITEYTTIYAKLTKNEEISDGKTIDIIANTHLDMQGYNITFKGNGDSTMVGSDADAIVDDPKAKILVEKNKKLYLKNKNKILYIFNANHNRVGIMSGTEGSSTTTAIKSSNNELYYLTMKYMDIDMGIDASSNIIRRITSCKIEGESESSKVEILGYPLIGENLILDKSLDYMLTHAEVHSFLEANKGQLSSSYLTIDSNETIELQKHDLVFSNSGFKITKGAKLIIKNEGKTLFSFKGDDTKTGILSVRNKYNGEFRLNPNKIAGLVIQDLDIIPEDVPVIIENCEVYKDTKENVLIGSTSGDNNIKIYNSLFEDKHPATNKTLTLNHAKLSGFNNTFKNISVKNSVSDNLCVSSSTNSAIYIRENVTFDNVHISNTSTKKATNSAVALINEPSHLTLKNSSITQTKTSDGTKAIDLICDTSKKSVGLNLEERVIIDDLQFKNKPTCNNILNVAESFKNNSDSKVNIKRFATSYAGEPKNNEWVNTKSTSLNLSKIQSYPESITTFNSSCTDIFKDCLSAGKITLGNYDWLGADKNTIGNAKANINDMTSLYVKNNILCFGMYQYNIAFSNDYSKATATCTNEGTPYYNKKIVCNFKSNPVFSPSGIETYKKAGKSDFYKNLEEYLDSYDIVDTSTTNYSIGNYYFLYPLNKSYTVSTLDNLITNDKHKGLIEALRLCTKIDTSGTDFSDIDKENYDSTITFNNLKKFCKIKNNDYLLIDISNARVDGGSANYLKNICCHDDVGDFDSNLLKDNAVEKINYSNLQKGKVYIEAYKNLNNSNLSVNVMYYPKDDEYISLTKEKNINDKKLILLKNGTDYTIKETSKLSDDTYKISIEGKNHFYNEITQTVNLEQCLLEKEYTGKIQYGTINDAVGYSTDEGSNWSNISPYFTNIGSYVYKYKTSSKAYYVQFIIAPTKINLTWSASTFTYNGKKQAPTIKSITEAPKKFNKNNINLTLYKKTSTGYTKVSSAINVGNYKITASLNSSVSKNYMLNSSNSSKTFTIKAKNIAKNIKLKYTKALAYTGKNLVPSIKVTYNKTTLKQNKDYKITKPSSTKKVGKYTATITLINNYQGSKKATYYIKYSIKKAKITAKRKKGKIYITVKYNKTKLKQNKDYKLKTVSKRRPTKINVIGIGKYAFTKQISIK